MDNSDLFAGLNIITLPDQAQDFGVAGIASVTVKGLLGVGKSFVESNIAAATLGRVSMRDVDAGDGTGPDFGLAALQIKSFSRLDQAGLVKLSNLDAPGDQDADSDDDFVILLF